MGGIECILTIGASCLMLMSGCVVAVLIWSLLYHVNLDDKNTVRAMITCFTSGMFFMIVTTLILKL